MKKFLFTILIALWVLNCFSNSSFGKPPVNMEPSSPNEPQVPGEPPVPGIPQIPQTNSPKEEIVINVYPVLNLGDKTLVHPHRLIYFFDNDECGLYRLSKENILKKFQFKKDEKKTRGTKLGLLEVPPAPWNFDKMWEYLYEENYSAEEFSHLWRMTCEKRLIEFSGKLVGAKFDRIKNQTQLFLKCGTENGLLKNTVLFLDGKLNTDHPNLEKDEIISFNGILKSFDRLKKIVLIDCLAIWKDKIHFQKK